MASQVGLASPDRLAFGHGGLSKGVSLYKEHVLSQISGSKINDLKPCRVCLVVSVSASHAVGCGFAFRLGHTKDHKNVCEQIVFWIPTPQVPGLRHIL